MIQSGVITVFGTLSLEEEKDAKVLANVISGAPKLGDKILNHSENAEPEKPDSKSHKRRGLFLRFSSRDDKNIENPLMWKGENLLGFALMEVRDRLNEMEKK